MQALRSHKFNTHHVPLPPEDKEDVSKLGQLLTFAICEWRRTQPENDAAASKHKALEAQVRFDRSRDRSELGPTIGPGTGPSSD